MVIDQDLIYNLPVAVYGCDTDGYIEFFNKAASTLWAAEPVLGKDRWCGSKKMYTLDGTPIRPGSSPMAMALKEKHISNSVMMIERHDGERRYIIPNPQLRYKPDGNILGAVNTLIDITTQIEEQKNIAENAEQFTALANSIPNLAWMAHPDGSIYWYNQNWFDYTGTTIDEMTGWGWKAVHDPDYLPTVLENWKHSIEQGKPFEMVFPLKGADNKYRSFLTRVFPVHNELGEVLHWFGTNTDINEQKKYSEILEATLMESESQKQAILQFAPDAVVSIDAQGRVLSWNPEATNIFGWNEQEVLGKTLTETIIPDRYAKKHTLGMEHYLKTGDGPVINKLIEVFAVKKNKEEIPIELKISATNINGREIFIGFIRDISLRKKAEETIKNRTNQLIEAQQLAHIGSWAWDIPSDKIDWSDELYRIYGLIPQEFEANYENYIQLIHPEDRKNVHDIVQQAFAEHEPFNLHHKIIHPDGTERIIRSTGKVFTDEQGQTVKMTGTAQDVTEQKRKEAELKESEERFFKIFDNNPVPLSLTEIKTNKITYVNNLFCASFGYTKEEIIGHTVEELGLIGAEEYQRVISYIFSHLKETRNLEEIQSLSVEETENLLLRLKETDAMKDFEVQYTKKNGASFPAIVSFEVLRIDSKHYTVTSYMDITERKKAEEKLKKQNVELEKNNKELESFTYISSHDLQEPLRKIQLFADRILDSEYERLSDKGKDHFKRMQNAAEKMRLLIKDLLAYSHANTSKEDQEYINLNDIVEDVKLEFSESIAEKGAIIEVQELGEIKIFHFQIRQLMQNLIGNSLKFSRPGHPPHIRIESEFKNGIDLQNENLISGTNYCHIKFEDNGIGFKKEYQDKIFEVFKRLHGSNDYPGSGIGLAIVKKIVENHNGLITASSSTNKGAIFDIYLPVD